MTHYAIIKVNRRDIEWEFDKERLYNTRFKKSAKEESYEDTVNNGSHSYKYLWKSEIELRGFDYGYYNTGTVTEWEGSVDLDILQVGVYIYVPSLDKYCLVTKVEAHTNGEITYYVDYKKEFHDSGEKSRIKAVEGWFECEYPMYDNYAQLINNRFDRDEYLVEYEEFYNGKE